MQPGAARGNVETKKKKTAAVVSLDERKHFEIQQETGTGNVHWLWDAGIHCIRSLLKKKEKTETEIQQLVGFVLAQG